MNKSILKNGFDQPRILYMIILSPMYFLILFYYRIIMKIQINRIDQDLRPRLFDSKYLRQSLIFLEKKYTKIYIYHINCLFEKF